MGVSRIMGIGVTEPTEEKNCQVAEIACAESDTTRNMPFEDNPDMVANAIRAADVAGCDAFSKEKTSIGMHKTGKGGHTSIRPVCPLFQAPLQFTTKAISC